MASFLKIIGRRRVDGGVWIEIMSTEECKCLLFNFFHGAYIME